MAMTFAMLVGVMMSHARADEPTAADSDYDNKLARLVLLYENAQDRWEKCLIDGNAALVERCALVITALQNEISRRFRELKP
jgi:hypothetical protein